MVTDTDIILDGVKRMLEIEQDTTEFDLDISTHVNSAFFSLYQLGIGPDTPFYIDATTTWELFVTKVPKTIILDYLFMKTKMVFDPPTSSSVIDAYKDRIAELEFRMNIYTDNGGGVVDG
jgi:hypothetical protein